MHYAIRSNFFLKIELNPIFVCFGYPKRGWFSITSVWCPHRLVPSGDQLDGQTLFFQRLTCVLIYTVPGWTVHTLPMEGVSCNRKLGQASLLKLLKEKNI